MDVVVVRSVARNVAGDAERSPANVVSPPLKVANGAASPAISVPHGRPKERPRSIGSQLEPLKAAGVKRTSSIRLEDISSPRLQSSTNHSVTSSRSEADADRSHGSKLQPSRAAPAPPVDLQPAHKPPQRPPPPCPAARDTAVSAAGSQYEEITLRSPTVSPPAPPDSRHRFYSSAQAPRQPTATSAADRADAVPAASVSSIRSKFEPAPVRSSSPSVAGQLAAASQRHVRRDVKNCSTVPAKSQPPAVARSQLTAARPSPAVNESQC